MYDIKESGKIRESKDTCAEDWIDVSVEIFDNYEKYDGFVILHGTDTMAFTASALSFMFENLGKPVVLTGAQVIWERLNNITSTFSSGAFISDKSFARKLTYF